MYTSTHTCVLVKGCPSGRALHKDQGPYTSTHTCTCTWPIGPRTKALHVYVYKYTYTCTWPCTRTKVLVRVHVLGPKAQGPIGPRTKAQGPIGPRTKAQGPIGPRTKALHVYVYKYTYTCTWPCTRTKVLVRVHVLGPKAQVLREELAPTTFQGPIPTPFLAQFHVLGPETWTKNLRSSLLRPPSTRLLRRVLSSTRLLRRPCRRLSTRTTLRRFV